MIRHIWLHGLGWIACFLLACCVIATMGCATTDSKVAYRLDKEGQPYDYKRHERYAQRDFRHHFARTAYRSPASTPTLALQGESPATIVENWGAPDWVRKPFQSLQDELVHEWIYLDQGRLFQFVDTKLVYEGPLTDHEIILLQRGYPDSIDIVRADNNHHEKMFNYFGAFGSKLETFKFVNDRLVLTREGQ